jgi:serine/threonine protein kinase
MLHITSGPHKGRRLAVLEGVPLVVGRSRHAETRLEDPGISRVHCEIQVEDGQVLVTDLDSAGGTFVNGKRVTEAVLAPGDVLRIGETSMRLEGAAGPSEAPTVPPPDARARPALPPWQTAEGLHELTGKVLSHYQVGPLIARGQSGLVFQALDYKDGSAVALKVLWPSWADNQGRRRFVRTVKTLVGLRHPNLVACRAAGKTGPFCWLAMEYVEGENLEDQIQRAGVAGRLDWRTAFQVAVQLASALEYAHGQGIIHRNLTPRNVLLQKADKAAKLGDLMLAKAIEGGLAEQLTRPGEILGDLRYMAPERTRGAEHVDARSDLYGLGALTYALLAGRPPFDGTTLVEKLTRICKEAPVPPRKYQLSVPDAFQDVVLRLLSKDPGERYQTATDLLKGLKQVARLNGLKLPQKRGVS